MVRGPFPFCGPTAPNGMPGTLGSRRLVEAELVAFGVLHHRPRADRLFEALNSRGPESDQPFCFGVDRCLPFCRLHRSVGDDHIEVTAILRSLRLRDLLDEDARAVSVRIDDRRELIPILLGNPDRIGERLPGVESLRWRLEHVAEGLAPELSQGPCVLRIERDLK